MLFERLARLVTRGKGPWLGWVEVPAFWGSSYSRDADRRARCGLTPPASSFGAVVRPLRLLIRFTTTVFLWWCRPLGIWASRSPLRGFQRWEPTLACSCRWFHGQAWGLYRVATFHRDGPVVRGEVQALSASGTFYTVLLVAPRSEAAAVRHSLQSIHLPPIATATTAVPLMFHQATPSTPLCSRRPPLTYWPAPVL